VVLFAPKLCHRLACLLFVPVVRLSHNVLREGFELARKHELDDLTLLLLNNEASTLYQLGDLSQAERICREVLELVKESGSPWDKIMALNVLGRIFVRLDQPVQARRYLMNAFLLGWQHKDTPTVLDTMVAIAELELSEGKYERAYKLLGAVLRHPATSARERHAAEQFLTQFDGDLAQHPARYLGKANALPFERWVPAFFGLEGEATEQK